MWKFGTDKLVVTRYSHQCFNFCCQDTPRKKKKRRSESSEELVTDVLAIGTTSGSILLYSMVKGDLQTELVRICF